MKPEGKIPQDLVSNEKASIRHFTTRSKMSIPYKERFKIIVRRYRASNIAGKALIVDLRNLSGVKQ